MPDIEIHPHSLFVPENAIVLILGSFPGRNNVLVEGNDEWFYSAQRNQFWHILRAVYAESLQTTKEKKDLFKLKGIAIGDIYLKVKRKDNNNSDNSLEVIEYNDKAILNVLNTHAISHIFATSQLVEKEFKKLFPKLENIRSLPSPSPRYARMSLPQKIAVYKKNLPV